MKILRKEEKTEGGVDRIEYEVEHVEIFKVTYFKVSVSDHLARAVFYKISMNVHYNIHE